MALDREFPVEAQERIAAAVRQAETRTTGQVVPVVVERSEPYEEARWIAAVLVAALVTGLAELLRWEPTIAELFALQIVGGVLGWLAGRLAPVERLLAGKRHQERAVDARAEQAFFEHGLHQTRDGTGVLIFASLRERRAVVIGNGASTSGWATTSGSEPSMRWSRACGAARPATDSWRPSPWWEPAWRSTSRGGTASWPGTSSPTS